MGMQRVRHDLANEQHIHTSPNPSETTGVVKKEDSYYPRPRPESVLWGTTHQGTKASLSPQSTPGRTLGSKAVNHSSEGGGTHLCCLCRVLSLRALAGQLLIFYLSDCRLFLEVDRE